MANPSSENFYEGGDSSLKPDFSSGAPYTGFTNLSGSQIGFSGNPMTSDQVTETVNAIKQGTKVFEVGALNQKTLEAIPKQHFDEIRALTKLTGVNPSFHAPLTDAAGFGERGYEGEETRVQNERKMFDAIQKGFLIDPDRNIPIVFHSGNAGGYTTQLIGEKDEKGKIISKVKSIPVINLESKQTVQVEDSRLYSIGHTQEIIAGFEDIKKGGKIMSAKDSIRNQNDTGWDKEINEFTLAKRFANQALNDAITSTKSVSPDGTEEHAFVLAKTQIKSEADKAAFKKVYDENPSFEQSLNSAATLISSNHQSLNTLFNKAYKYGSEKQKLALIQLSSDWNQDTHNQAEAFEKAGVIKLNNYEEQIMENNLQEKYVDRLKAITEPRYLQRDGIVLKDEKTGKKLRDENFGAPKVHVNASDYAMDEAAKTFGNLAIRSYNEYKEKAPTIVVENIWEGLGFSTADDMRKLLDKSRAGFEKFLRKKGKSESEAKKIAAKQLGVTWDMGHINMAKGKGFDDKYVEEETAKIAEYVKHVHVTDNFGFEDSHLIPGMGNVPIKKVLEALEKEGKIDEMKMIVEAGGINQAFKKLPHQMSLGAFNAGLGGAPSGQTGGMMGDYFGGYGTVSPEQHHTMYGAGFTTMPAELGGQMPGGQSRFGGTPMA
ncbi:hypothetical protein HN604_00115 [archaeon]|jgi:hypothetical protein|nr:hypothetical protein [archaeon]MBT7251414.1 hypothetical protein [archaeon]MBT7660469.1 hypothetical protein [archaeon]